MSFLKIFVDTSPIGIINIINWVFITLLGVLSAYKILYIILGFFCVKRFKKTEKQHKYAFMIAARNESAVIGNLIDSIWKSKYPKELLTIFVVADNCTDNTAELCRSKGCIVYERFNKEKIGKGYALKELTAHINQDYGMTSFEGFFVFDADNLIAPNYIEKMNEAFDSGVKIVTSYRNTKNFDTNFISASYGYHQYRNIRSLHIPRTALNLSCTVTGTGFLVSSEILKDGWKWELITEDSELTVDSLIDGYQIQYCHDAVFYDEQPTTFKVMFRQRIRWAKGRLMVFASRFKQLVKNIFVRNKKAPGNGTNNQKPIQKSFAFYDMMFEFFPYALITFFWKLLYYLALIIAFIVLQMNVGDCFANMGWATLKSFGILYLTSFIQILPVVFCEWKRIKCNSFMKILYMFTFPIFDLFNILIMTIALFTHVEWKPIPHKDTTVIDEIVEYHEEKKAKKENKQNKNAKEGQVIVVEDEPQLQNDKK